MDGPGSGNLREDEKWVVSKPYAKWKGEIFGRGWEENVQHAIAVLKKDVACIKNDKQLANAMRREMGPDKPTHVNLVGWSRGGVTCHMMANAMLNDPQLCSIPVNIFAVDPVPGLGQFKSHRTQIGVNVRQYYAVYARDEHSIGFTPTLPAILNQAGSVAQIIPMPGRHATVVGNASATAEGEHTRPTNYPQPGKIVRHLVEQKLTEWGARLENRLNLSNSQLLKLYDDMLGQEADYQKMGKNSYTKMTNQFSSTRTVGVGNDYLNTSWNDIIFLRAPSLNANGKKNIFVNNHHMTLFINESIFIKNNLKGISQYPATVQRIHQLSQQ